MGSPQAQILVVEESGRRQGVLHTFRDSSPDSGVMSKVVRAGMAGVA